MYLSTYPKELIERAFSRICLGVVLHFGVDDLHLLAFGVFRESMVNEDYPQVITNVFAIKGKVLIFGNYRR